MNNIIIIPYRNREKHLNYFIKNSVPLLKKYLKNLKIVVVEQANDKLFNRGMLINIGFNENKYDNVIYYTHDVDVNPFEKTIEKYYLTNLKDNEINGIYTSICNTLGGIISFNKNTFVTINGFPNDFWGWGVEDKALQNRATFYKIKINKHVLSKTPLANESFFIFDDNHVRTSENLENKTNFEYRKFDTLNNKLKLEHIQKTGLCNLKYNVIEKINLDVDIELIKVDI